MGGTPLTPKLAVALEVTVSLLCRVVLEKIIRPPQARAGLQRQWDCLAGNQ